MSTRATEFKPTNTPAQGLNPNVPVFNPQVTFVPKTPGNPFVPSGIPAQPLNTTMNTTAPTFAPAAKPVEAPLPKEIPKEKHVLMIERIVKGSDTDVKSDALTADDSATVTKLV